MEQQNPVTIILYILFALMVLYLLTHLPKNNDFSDYNYSSSINEIQEGD